MTPPFFGSKITNLLVFFDFEPKKCFRVPTPWGLYAVYALLIHSCYVGGFGNLGDPVTLRGVSGDIVTVYAY